MTLANAGIRPLLKSTLAPTSSIRLLRVQYYLPWRLLPPSTKELDPWVRRNLQASRITGFLFVASITGFFVAMIAEASG
jgi:hypothetical protein